MKENNADIINLFGAPEGEYTQGCGFLNQAILLEISSCKIKYSRLSAKYPAALLLSDENLKSHVLICIVYML